MYVYRQHDTNMNQQMSREWCFFRLITGWYRDGMFPDHIYEPKNGDWTRISDVWEFRHSALCFKYIYIPDYK